jgi:dodecin
VATPHGCRERTGPFVPGTLPRSNTMSVAKITEIQSSSTKSFDDAIQTGIARADKTLRNLTGAWVKSQKVMIENGKITEYRVEMDVIFILE